MSTMDHIVQLYDELLRNATETNCKLKTKLSHYENIVETQNMLLKVDGGVLNRKDAWSYLAVPPSPPSNVIQSTTADRLLPEQKVFSHFLSHIPKTGATSAFVTLNRILFETPEWQKLPPSKQFRGCNVGTRPLSTFDKNFRREFGGTKCTLWMSEQPYSTRPHNTYTIIRNPIEHVLSMYFHCTESIDHARFQNKQNVNADKLMATEAMKALSLDDWLATWLSIFEYDDTLLEQGIHEQSPQGSNHDIAREKIQNITKSLGCYNPINMQSRFTKFGMTKFFQQAKGNVTKTFQLAKDDLRERYTVLGTTHYMTKSICLIAIHYAGFVPAACDCSGSSRDYEETDAPNNEAESSSGPTEAPTEGDAEEAEEEENAEETEVPDEEANDSAAQDASAEDEDSEYTEAPDEMVELGKSNAAMFVATEARDDVNQDRDDGDDERDETNILAGENNNSENDRNNEDEERKEGVDHLNRFNEGNEQTTKEDEVVHNARIDMSQAQREPIRRQLSANATSKVAHLDHGVKHHGATYRPTPSQEKGIGKLTRLDRLLYRLVQEIFAEQVEEIEEEYDITICDKLS